MNFGNVKATSKTSDNKPLVIPIYSQDKFRGGNEIAHIDAINNFKMNQNPGGESSV